MLYSWEKKWITKHSLWPYQVPLTNVGEPINAKNCSFGLLTGPGMEKDTSVETVLTAGGESRGTKPARVRRYGVQRQSPTAKDRLGVENVSKTSAIFVNLVSEKPL